MSEISIAEKLGAEKHSYIPSTHRQDRAEADGEGKRQTLLNYIKEHEGEKITYNDVKDIVGFKFTSEFSYYSRQLEKSGKISRIKDGVSYRLYLGKRSDPRKNSPVRIKRQAAPFSKSEVDRLADEQWQFVRNKTTEYTDEALGAVVRGMVQFGEYLNGKVEIRDEDQDQVQP